MKNYKWLQLFSEGGDGGDAGASAPAEESSGQEATGEGNPELDSMLSRIPERGKTREIFKKAYEKTHPSAPAPEPATEPKAETVHIPYADLIKSDEYKAEHKAYMDKTISDRFKKNDAEMNALRERDSQSMEVLGLLAQIYEIDPNGENFIGDLKNKIETDESLYEAYGMKYDMSSQEARKNIQLEMKAKRVEAMEQAQRQAQAMEAQRRENNAAIQTMMGYAQETKKLYPEFDLNAEMQNDDFRRLVVTFRGDTTRAYKAMHIDELMERSTAENAAKAKQAITNSIASGQTRPIEGGLSNKTPASIDTSYDWKGKNTKQMIEYAKTHFVKR